MSKSAKPVSPLMSPLSWPCMRIEHKGKVTRVILDISVSPNAKKTELVGWHDGALRVRLSAPPVDGAANEALRRWLSEQLQIPQARIELLRGASGRRKQWALAVDEAQACAWLAAQNVLKSQGDDH
jgi:uncharacterized protein